MSKFTLPKQLQKDQFRFVRLQEKKPFERGWQKNGYKFDDPKLLQHLSLKQNVGVIGGYGSLRIQDIDDPEIAKKVIDKFNTFTIRTGSGGIHCYFICDLADNFVLRGEDAGEFRANNYQVVAPNMKHPNGNFYKVERDMPIRNISKEDFLDIVKPYLRDAQLQKYFGEGIKTTLDCSTGKLKQSGNDESKSAFEYRRVIALIKQNKTKEEIFKEMNRYSKWMNAPEQYRELTYEKARKYVEGLEIIEEESESLNVLDYKSLMDYKIEPLNWLIKDQIPKGELGFLVGKRGHKKTWMALKQALALASGNSVFGCEIVEKKKVLILDEESGENVLANRLQLLAKADGITKDELELSTISLTGLRLDKPDSKKHIEFLEIIENLRPDLIIVDCLQRVCGFDIDKENSMISDLFTGTVRPIMKKYGMTWLFVHHMRKGQTGTKVSDPLDEVRGGSELVNYARFVLMCETPRNQNKNDDGSEMLIFKVLKMSNSILPEPKVISFIPDSPTPENSSEIKMDYLGKVEDVLKTEIRVANAIKEFLFKENIKSFTPKELKARKDELGFSERHITSGLTELYNQGFLERPKRGLYVVTAGETAAEGKQKTLEANNGS